MVGRTSRFVEVFEVCLSRDEVRRMNEARKERMAAGQAEREREREKEMLGVGGGSGG